MLNQKKLDTKMLDAIKWKYLGSETGTNSIPIPSGWNELIVTVGKDGSYTPYHVVDTGRYTNGRFPSNGGQQTIDVSANAVYIVAFYIGTTESKTSATIKAWYR